MYCVVESPKVLNLPISDLANIKYLKANRDNMFICILTSNDIMIWFSTSSTLIAFYQRADNSVQIHGENHLVEWKNDSSKIVIMTTKGYLIYYKIAFENEFVITDLSYAQTAWNDSLFSNKNQYQNPLLGCKITHEFSIHIQNAHRSLSCFNDEIFVPLLNGKIIKVPWTDKARADHFFLLLQRIYFQHDSESELFKLKDNIYACEFEIITSDDGCICVAAALSDGSAIYMFTDSTNVFRGLITKTHDKNLFHKCVLINPLYKLIVFGCKNGSCVAYNKPDDYSSLELSHKYLTNSKEYDSANVVCLRWSPDFRVLCALYDNGSFCLFSVFGSLLYDSKDLLSFQYNNITYNVAKSLEFGIEGFSLWAFMQNTDASIQGSLIKLKILKSSLINNCSMANIEHIALNGEREVYVCLNLTKIDAFLNTNRTENMNTNGFKSKIPPKYQYPSLKIGGNSMWQILNIPLTYISSNFPIRMSAIDPEGKYLAVAGSSGFTHFSFVTRKWKIFGNADQEKEIKIIGGIIWWKEFICISCYNIVDQKDELRFYSRNTNLDNNYSKKSRTTSTILQMNILKNSLILFGSDCRIQVIGLEGGKDSISKIVLNKLIEIPIEQYLQGNPYLVTAISLSPLFVGIDNELIRKNIESTTTNLKSVLINVSGKLLMLQPDADGLLSIPEDLKKSKPFSSMPPILISNCVENYWMIPNNQNLKLMNHLINFTLWLNCGGKGVKLWLPLSGEEKELRQSNRAILNLPIKFYPLGLLVNEAIFVGLNTELTLINQNTAYTQLNKSTQLFVPFILEGLIRKKLVLDAKKIAVCYRYLPYFLHVLELLVHRVLEEEATQTKDPRECILQDVIDFIEQFPEYLKIISHCTRKSEVAVWPHLFSIVGDSRLLFEKCLNLNDLDTAASYLVVLQNSANLKLCQKFANMLLRAALKSCEWDLIKEIIRFLSSIDPADLENDVFETTQNSSINSKPNDSPDTINNTKTSTSSLSSLKQNKPVAENSLDEPETPTSIPKTNAANKRLSKTRSFSSYDCEMTKKSIENTIYEHAQFLISNFRLKQLFDMFANLNCLNLLKWLQQYQPNNLIGNYVQALKSVHFEFNWPYPILINEFKKTNSFVTNLTDKELNHTNGNGTTEDNKEKQALRKNSEPLDFNLIAQELANCGSIQCEKQLSYMIDAFIAAKCWEWVFLLALVLKRFSIINEIMRMVIADELVTSVVSNLKKGINDLVIWTENECCGYRQIIKKISELC